MTDQTCAQQTDDSDRLRAMALQVSLHQEGQRRTIAIEIHDHISQPLALAKIQLSRLRANAIFEGCDNQIAQIRELIDEAIQYTRSVTQELASPVLYELGLKHGIEAMIEKKRKDLGLNITFNCTTAVSEFVERFDQKRQIIVFKAIREFLFNIIKHAHAKNVHIVLEQYNECLKIMVHDDGRGFNTASHSDGIGLFTIREGLRYFGGKLTITSEARTGTTIEMLMPLDGPEKRNKC